MSLERIPPQNLEAEQSLLGCLLIDKEGMNRVADIIRSDDFYRDAHKHIYNVIADLYERHEPIDLLSLGNRLEEKNLLSQIGGRAYLVELSNMVPTSAHVVNYAKIIQKKASLRRLIETASYITQLGFEEAEEIDATLDAAQRAVFNVSQRHLSQNFIPIKDVLAGAFERIDELHRDRGKLRVVPTGYRDLDNLLAGLQKS